MLFMRKQYIVSALFMLFAAIGMYGILPQLGSFGASLQAIQHARPTLALLAALIAFAGYACATGVYVLLAYKVIPFGATFLVQIAGLFINRVVPAGIGGIGLNFLYLRAHKHSNIQATTVVSLNGLAGLIAHLTLLIVVILIHPSTIVNLLSHVAWRQNLFIIILVIAGIAGVVALLGRIRSQRIAKTRANLLHQAKLLRTYYAKRPARLLASLFLAGCITLSSVVSLWLCCQAVGLDVSLYIVFVVYTFGVILGTAVPVPGGLGATEAALVAGLVAQNISVPSALAAVLLFRLVTFWLGLVVGAGATAVMQSRRLLQTT